MANHSVDGVVVKVAERYRVPPRILVPEEVVQLVCGDHYKRLVADTEVEYDFNLERNVIQKIDEWQRVHDQSEHVRQEQLRARDRERRQNQEKEQKHLLNQVSYPSTDDLSSDNDDTRDDDDSPEGDQHQQQQSNSSNKPPVVEGNGNTVPTPQPLPRDFSCILKPTIVPESHAIDENNKVMSTWSVALSSKGTSGQQNGVAAINYSEWESDNYSPFDRMELKSINDLDILAQVLQTTQLAHNAEKAKDLEEKKDLPEELPAVAAVSPPQITSPIPEACVSPPPSAAQIEATKPDPPAPVATGLNANLYTESFQYPPWQYNNHPPTTVAPQNHPIATFPTYHHRHHDQAVSTAASQQPQMDYSSPSSNGTPTNYYHNNQQHHHQYQQQPQHSNNNGGYLPQQQQHPMHYSGALYQQQQYTNHYQYQHQPQQFNGMTNAAEMSRNSDSEDPSVSSSSSLLRSRSKSVPDIMHELEEEVKASEQRRRTRNHSQSAKAADDEESEDGGNEGGRTAASPDDSDPLERLTTAESKELAIKFSKMGFSLNVVATVIQQLGNDDKKIIEHLIPLCELLDLGFDVSPTSEALLKFNNNRERALDFLIS